MFLREVSLDLYFWTFLFLTWTITSKISLFHMLMIQLYASLFTLLATEVNLLHPWIGTGQRSSLGVNFRAWSLMLLKYTPSVDLIPWIHLMLFFIFLVCWESLLILKWHLRGTSAPCLALLLQMTGLLSKCFKIFACDDCSKIFCFNFLHFDYCALVFWRLLPIAI